MATAYDKLVAKGCTCGERPQDCPLHKAGDDNRGIAAFYRAGLPSGFPLAANCGTCGAEGLLYPNVEIDDPKGTGEHKPTLVCPNCSTAASEWKLRRECEAFGSVLNDKLIFAAGSTCSPGVLQMLRFVEQSDDETLNALEVAWHATADGSNSTADFFSDGDGQILYAEDGPKPSYALAMLFDYERFMGGNECALDWSACTEASA